MVSKVLHYIGPSLEHGSDLIPSYIPALLLLINKEASFNFSVEAEANDLCC